MKRSNSHARATVLLSQGINVVRALEARGIDGAAFLRRAGCDPALFHVPETRIPNHVVQRVFELAEEATGDPCFGLDVGRQVRGVALHAVGHAWLASATLLDAMSRLARYTRVLTDLWRAELREEPRGLRFVILYADPQAVRPLSCQDAVLAGILQLCRITYGDAFAPLEASVGRERLADPRRFEDWFRAPIVWGSPSRVSSAGARTSRGRSPRRSRHRPGERAARRRLSRPARSRRRAGASGPALEVLLRLKDESGASIAPAEFMRAAERYRLMPHVDRWVVQTALAALGRGAVRMPQGRSLCINLSGQTLGDPSFLEFVVETLDHTGVSPSQVCFEVTETSVIGNLELARRFIGGLHGMGCQFALDDFGNDLGSFANLKNLAMDYIKIEVPSPAISRTTP